LLAPANAYPLFCVNHGYQKAPGYQEDKNESRTWVSC